MTARNIVRRPIIIDELAVVHRQVGGTLLEVRAPRGVPTRCHYLCQETIRRRHGIPRVVYKSRLHFIPRCHKPIPLPPCQRSNGQSCNAPLPCCQSCFRAPPAAALLNLPLVLGSKS